MGANTYIGNAPNFMVYAMARDAGVRMPGFFGYMLWSGAILVPLFAVVDGVLRRMSACYAFSFLVADMSLSI